MDAPEQNLPKPEKKRAFISYIHHFRGLAIIFVVAGHLLMDWPEDSLVHRFLRMFWENGTVLFIFIAGYLFQYLSAKFTYKKYLVTKVKNVLIPYLIVSVPIIVYRLVTSDYPGYITSFDPNFTDYPTWRKLLFFYSRGAHMQQLWFVPMITLFYLMAPLLLAIDKRPKWYYLLIPFVIVSLFVVREPFSDILKMTVHFFSVYLFGMFMSRYKDAFLVFAQRYRIILNVLVLAVLVINYLYFTELNYMLNYVQKMLLCGIFIYWLWKLEKFVPSFFSVLADLSFGIFFIHYYVLLVIKAVYEYAFKSPIPGNLFYWIIYLILVMLGSVVVIKMVQKIFGKKSRMLIGC